METNSKLKVIFNQKVHPYLEKLEQSRLFSRFGRKTWWILATVFVLIVGGGITFYQSNSAAIETEAATPLQTAIARRGDLIIYASGTGTLTAIDDVSLGFTTGGPVQEINVEVGDVVSKSDVLAAINDSSAQIQYTQAKRALLELTSTASVAAAEQAIAEAKINLATAVDLLSYLISPQVYYWENEVASAENELEVARTAAENSPNDANLQTNLTKAEDYLDYVQDKLTGSQYYYEHQYLRLKFTVWSRTYGKYIAAPSDEEISAARAGLTQAQATLQEAQYLYAALTGGEVPEDATGSGLTELEQANLDLESAQLALQGTTLTTPINGTVMSIAMSVGDTVDTAPMMTIADLSEHYLEVFLDESDWTSVQVGYPTVVIFDILPDTTFSGIVVQVDPGLYEEAGTSTVRAIVQLTDVNEEDFNLPLGTSAAVDVIGGEATNVVLIPVEALHEAGPGQYAVYVLVNNNPQLHLVEIGIQDLTSVEITSGLEAGDVVSTGITETQTQ